MNYHEQLMTKYEAVQRMFLGFMCTAYVCKDCGKRMDERCPCRGIQSRCEPDHRSQYRRDMEDAGRAHLLRDGD